VDGATTSFTSLNHIFYCSADLREPIRRPVCHRVASSPHLIASPTESSDIAHSYISHQSMLSITVGEVADLSLFCDAFSVYAVGKLELHDDAFLARRGINNLHLLRYSMLYLDDAVSRVGLHTGGI
jgi:hypothetical protein